VITTCEQLIIWAVTHRVIVEFLNNENVKPAEILNGLRADFGDETFS